MRVLAPRGRATVNWEFKREAPAFWRERKRDCAGACRLREARAIQVHGKRDNHPVDLPDTRLYCLPTPRAIRPPALGLYLGRSFTVSRNTSPMTSVSVSGVVSTRAANFLMRLFGAITASLIAEPRPSSVPTGAIAPALRRGSDGATVRVGCWPRQYLRPSSGHSSAKLAECRALIGPGVISEAILTLAFSGTDICAGFFHWTVPWQGSRQDK